MPGVDGALDFRSDGDVRTALETRDLSVYRLQKMGSFGEKAPKKGVFRETGKILPKKVLVRETGKNLGSKYKS